MKIIAAPNAPRYERDRIRSYLLIGESTVGARHIATTLVEMEPGGVQKPHQHETEQCYMILEGSGTMEVDGERAGVNAGDAVFIPSNSVHGLVNDGDAVLKYLSAGSPVFGASCEKKLWPIKKE